MINESSIFICPQCQYRCVRQPGTGDFVHQCQGVSALSQESLLVIGPWEDYTGSNSSVAIAVMQGVESNLDGTRAGLAGDKNWPRNSQGFPTPRFRQRQHLEYIPSDTFKSQDAATNSTQDPDNYDE